jgi:hypothetical protein
MEQEAGREQPPVCPNRGWPAGRTDMYDPAPSAVTSEDRMSPAPPPMLPAYLEAAPRGIMWVIGDHRALQAHVIPGHAGDRGALRLDPGVYDHLHISHENAFLCKRLWKFRTRLFRANVMHLAPASSREIAVLSAAER